MDLRYLVPRGLRYPVVRLLAARCPRVLPLYYIGVAAGREFAAERLTDDVIQGVSYTRVYDRYLRSWRGRTFTMLEIGVWRGASLRMWSRYFRRATVIGLDIDPEAADRAPEFAVYTGSQDDPTLLDQVLAENPNVRIVVDDGSHVNELTISTFRHLFPRLPSGSLYFIEDLGVSYEDGPLAPDGAPDGTWPGIDLSRPASHRRADIDSLLADLIRDCDLGGAGRTVGFLHVWPMCLVIERA